MFWLLPPTPTPTMVWRAGAARGLLALSSQLTPKAVMLWAHTCLWLHLVA